MITAILNSNGEVDCFVRTNSMTLSRQVASRFSSSSVDCLQAVEREMPSLLGGSLLPTNPRKQE